MAESAKFDGNSTADQVVAGHDLSGQVMVERKEEALLNELNKFATARWVSKRAGADIPRQPRLEM